MKINEKLIRLFEKQAEKTTISNLTIGIGYTAVLTDDGGMGIAYTYFNDKSCCLAWEDYYNYENRPASELLNKISSKNTIERSLALALINALNYNFAAQLPEDRSNSLMLNSLGFEDGMRVAMVGHIKPLEKIFLERRAQVEVIDTFSKIGSTDSFYPKLKDWADVLIITSSAILNNTLDYILSQASPGIRIAIMGPGTPMVENLFTGFPVCYLGGTVPVKQEEALRVIRHGMGTRMIHKQSRKVYLSPK